MIAKKKGTVIVPLRKEIDKLSVILTKKFIVASNSESDED